MVANSLRGLRKSRCLSQRDVARMLNVTQQAIASWENGRTEPSNMALVEIADYFNVSVDYLLGRTDNPNVLKGVS